MNDFNVKTRVFGNKRSADDFAYINAILERSSEIILGSNINIKKGGGTPIGLTEKVVKIG